MSNENNIPNEDELWELLSEPVNGGASPKPADAEPEAPAQEEPEIIVSRPVRTRRRVDGFFMACMAGVAAVSVAATLVLGGILGGQPSAPSGSSGAADHDISALEQENAELKAQLELQRKQILDLQTSLMNQMGAEEFLENAATDPSGSNEVLDAQVEAYEILADIQEAYANFDREKLEELIPEMDARLEYLSSDALNTYYLILEYVEQPSNG